MGPMIFRGIIIIRKYSIQQINILTR